MTRSRLMTLLLAVAAVCAVCAGCSSGSAASGAAGPPTTSNPARVSLVRAARLAPCPTSSRQSAQHALPDAALPCLGNGPAVNLAGLRGTPTVVNLWASWCVQCRAELPWLSALAHQRDVRVLGVDTADTDDSALSFAGSLRPAMHYPSVADPSRTILDGIHISPGLPDTAFVDSAGAVVHVHAGPYASAAALRRDVATYLHVDA